MQDRTLLSATLVPQSNDLGAIRRVVAAAADGDATPKTLAIKTGISKRHVGYALQAARVLGLLGSDAQFTLTERGRRVLETREDTLEERAELRCAILESPALRQIAPDLLNAIGPTVEELRDRIMLATRALSESTAHRRAQTLLAWRARLL
jgi:hypothetical protein